MKVLTRDLHPQLFVGLGSLLQFLNVCRGCCRSKAEDGQAESDRAHGSPTAFGSSVTQP
jgi:hypothetical protein